MKKKWKIILGAFLVIAAAFTLLFNSFQGVEAQVLEVQPRTIAKTFTEEGIVFSEAEYPLYTATGGKIAAIPVREGQRVAAGELLLVFDTTELQYQLSQLQGQLKSTVAQRDLESSKISLEKMKQLYEAGAISKKEYEDALNTVTSGYYPGQIESLQAQIDLTQHLINECHVTAPADGIVSRLDVKKGMYIQPGTPLLTLFSDDSYLVETFVLTEDVVKLGPGTQVELVQDNKDADVSFPGTVEEIAPSAVERTSALGLFEQRVKVTIRPHIPPGLVLRPGYALDVRFTTGEQKERLVVPKTALFPLENGDALWVVRNGKTQIQKVKTGFENDREIVIEEGLEAGDLVVLNPQLEGLGEGKKVRVRK